MNEWAMAASVAACCCCCSYLFRFRPSTCSGQRQLYNFLYKFCVGGIHIESLVWLLASRSKHWVWVCAQRSCLYCYLIGTQRTTFRQEFHNFFPEFFFSFSIHFKYFFSLSIFSFSLSLLKVTTGHWSCMQISIISVVFFGQQKWIEQHTTNKWLCRTSTRCRTI